MKKITDIYKGDSRSFRFTFTDTSTGLPLDLTGRTVGFSVKTRESVAGTPIDKDVTVHEDAANGVTVIEITGAESLGMTAGLADIYAKVKGAGGVGGTTIPIGLVRFAAQEVV